MLNYFGRPHFPEKSEAHSCTQQSHLGRGLLQETRLPDLREHLRFLGATPALFRSARSRRQIRFFQPEHVQDCNALRRNSAAAPLPGDNEQSPRQFRLGREGRCPDCNAPSSSRDFLPASPCTTLLSHGRCRSAATSKSQKAGVFRTWPRGEKVSI